MATRTVITCDRCKIEIPKTSRVFTRDPGFTSSQLIAIENNRYLCDICPKCAGEVYFVGRFQIHAHDMSEWNRRIRGDRLTVFTGGIEEMSTAG